MIVKSLVARAIVEYYTSKRNALFVIEVCNSPGMNSITWPYFIEGVILSLEKVRYVKLCLSNVQQNLDAIFCSICSNGKGKQRPISFTGSLVKIMIECKNILQSLKRLFKEKEIHLKMSLNQPKGYVFRRTENI